jgi:hypothetical protein
LLLWAIVLGGPFLVPRAFSLDEPRSDTGSGKDDRPMDVNRKGLGKLSREREKRMLRWVLKFNIRDGGRNEYFQQLSGLGLILAIPEDKEVYRVVYYPPGARKVKKVEELNHIYWTDHNKKAVAEVMEALGLKERPSHLVAFMPQELEEKLVKMEVEHARKKERTIEDIQDTGFIVVKKGTRYEVELKEMRFREKQQ